MFFRVEHWLVIFDPFCAIAEKHKGSKELYRDSRSAFHAIALLPVMILYGCFMSIVMFDLSE